LGLQKRRPFDFAQDRQAAALQRRSAFVEGPGGGALAIAEVGFFFGADGFAERAPLLIVIGENGFFEIGGAGEEDVHGIADDTADVETAAEFAETFAERKSEAGGLVMLEIVETGVGAGEAENLVKEEMERGREALEEFEFGIVHAEAEFVFALGGGNSGAAGLRRGRRIPRAHGGRRRRGYGPA